jgi:hypothetical protein
MGQDAKQRSQTLLRFSIAPSCLVDVRPASPTSNVRTIVEQIPYSQDFQLVVYTHCFGRYLAPNNAAPMIALFELP